MPEAEHILKQFFDLKEYKSQIPTIKPVTSLDDIEEGCNLLVLRSANTHDVIENIRHDGIRKNKYDTHLQLIDGKIHEFFFKPETGNIIRLIPGFIASYGISEKAVQKGNIYKVDFINASN